MDYLSRKEFEKISIGLEDNNYYFNLAKQEGWLDKEILYEDFLRFEHLFKEKTGFTITKRKYYKYIDTVNRKYDFYNITNRNNCDKKTYIELTNEQYFDLIEAYDKEILRCARCKKG